MRRDPERHAAVVTPWYPDAQIPFRGAFVEAMVAAVAPGLDRLDVIHLDGWLVRGGADRRGPIWGLQSQLLPRSVRTVPAVGGASLRRVPAMVPRTKDYAVHAAEYARWLGIALEGRPIEAPVIHAHVPVLAAWAALENCRPGARVYATEHSSFLDTVFESAAARDIYDQVLERCAGFFVVGEALRDQIGRTFPHHADKIGFIANPIDFGARRPAPTRLRRWVSVAALKEVKRTDHVIRAFAECRADDPGLTLTLVGDGALRGSLEALCDELGVREAVDFCGMVEPQRIPAILAEHDLLVHPSQSETFGVVVVEAIAAGLPVLVTRCGGPERVLEGIEDDAGLLVDVDDDPAVLAAGYRALRERHPEKTDVNRARHVLRAKYSYEAVAKRHYRIWYGE